MKEEESRMWRGGDTKKARLEESKVPMKRVIGQIKEKGERQSVLIDKKRRKTE